MCCQVPSPKRQAADQSMWPHGAGVGEMEMTINGHASYVVLCESLSLPICCAIVIEVVYTYHSHAAQSDTRGFQLREQGNDSFS